MRQGSARRRRAGLRLAQTARGRCCLQRRRVAQRRCQVQRECIDELGNQRRRELGQQLFVILDLGIELLPSAGQGTQRVLRRSVDVVDPARTQAGASGGSASSSTGAAIPHAERVLPHQHGLEADHGCGACFPRSVLGNLDLAQHLDRPVVGLRDRVCLSGQTGASGVLRVKGVGLTTQSPIATVGAQHLRDTDVAAAHRSGQPCAIRNRCPRSRTSTASLRRPAPTQAAAGNHSVRGERPVVRTPPIASSATRTRTCLCVSTPMTTIRRRGSGFMLVTATSSSDEGGGRDAGRPGGRDCDKTCCDQAPMGSLTDQQQGHPNCGGQS